MSIKIVKYIHNDHFKMACKLKLRLSDQEEILASSEINNPTDILIRSIYISEEVYAVMKDDNELIALLGVADSIGGYIGSPWLLGSDGADRCSITFVKQGRKYVQKWVEKYDSLQNYVQVTNKKSLQWLGSLGFQFDRELYYFTEDAAPFLLFYMTNNKD